MKTCREAGIFHPFCPENRFDLPVPGIEYQPDHPLMKQMNESCNKRNLADIKRLMTKWQVAPDDWFLVARSITPSVFWSHYGIRLSESIRSMSSTFC